MVYGNISCVIRISDICIILHLVHTMNNDIAPEPTPEQRERTRKLQAIVQPLIIAIYILIVVSLLIFGNNW
jgi:hypothetical protein